MFLNLMDADIYAKEEKEEEAAGKILNRILAVSTDKGCASPYYWGSTLRKGLCLGLSIDTDLYVVPVLNEHGEPELEICCNSDYFLEDMCDDLPDVMGNVSGFTA